MSPFFLSGKSFPGSRDDIIKYMNSVGYNHIPDGHKEIMENRIFFFFLIDPVIRIKSFAFALTGLYTVYSTYTLYLCLLFWPTD